MIGTLRHSKVRLLRESTRRSEARAFRQREAQRKRDLKPENVPEVFGFLAAWRRARRANRKWRHAHDRRTRQYSLIYVWHTRVHEDDVMPRRPPAPPAPRLPMPAEEWAERIARREAKAAFDAGRREASVWDGIKRGVLRNEIDIGEPCVEIVTTGKVKL